MKKPLVINFFGGAGLGKSTVAAYVFSQLKIRGVSCELISEFAKDLTWEKNKVALECQEYVFGNQSFKMEKCRNEVDVLITDCPLILGYIYNKNPLLNDNFKEVVLSKFNSYENINYVINRTINYDSTGRNQNYLEAIDYDTKILNFLTAENISYLIIEHDNKEYDKIVSNIVQRLNNKKLTF